MCVRWCIYIYIYTHRYLSGLGYLDHEIQGVLERLDTPSGRVTERHFMQHAALLLDALTDAPDSGHALSAAASEAGSARSHVLDRLQTWQPQVGVGVWRGGPSVPPRWRTRSDDALAVAPTKTHPPPLRTGPPHP